MTKTAMTTTARHRVNQREMKVILSPAYIALSCLSSSLRRRRRRTYILVHMLLSLQVVHHWGGNGSLTRLEIHRIWRKLML
ncbi:hypothetical protein RP20_CCG012359 [Aedes albopictus]|nr:hypothetical protein RP20_CCG012359 [Aedes albopictus]